MHNTATPGIHHITAIAGSARQNLAFYRDLLGLRLVKKTVNFDDPTTYHLYYGDEAGTPGTILTFFPWEGMARGRPGSGQVVSICFQVPPGSFPYWESRLAGAGVATQRRTRFDEELLGFSDPDGMDLELVSNPSAPGMPTWEQGGVPAEHAVRGFHSATALLRDATRSVALLQDLFGMNAVGQEANRTRFRMGSATNVPGVFYDVVEDRSAERGHQGTGTVHHIAFRAETHEQQNAVRNWLTHVPLQVTPSIDRTYFRSIYFREPGGVLFEVATDTPGFAADEPADRLGSSLMLPPQHEPHRAEIERALPPLDGGEGIAHVYLPATRANAVTVLALHGTGGDENDLVPLAQQVAPGQAVLSPRGQVNEGGLNRFFRRLRLNVFDEEDIRRRANEWAAFLQRLQGQHPDMPRAVYALSYSNGANMAAALLLLQPGALRGAVLIRPMLPLLPPHSPDLRGVPVLILAGRRDTVIPAESTLALIEVLERCGATVTVERLEAGHEITEDDVRLASAFFQNLGDAAFS